jgi:hypothetical protein
VGLDLEDGTKKRLPGTAPSKVTATRLTFMQFCGSKAREHTTTPAAASKKKEGS